MSQLRKWEKPRYQFLREMIDQHNFSVGAEIGVRRGETSFYLLNNCKSLTKLYLVDNWGHTNRNTMCKKHEMSWEIFSGVLKMLPMESRSKAAILKMDSLEASHSVLGKSLDFVFIDADHAYGNVLDDILVWSRKVRKGGLISGHDYGGDQIGVTKAVDEMFKNKGLMILGHDTVWYVWKS